MLSNPTTPPTAIARYFSRFVIAMELTTHHLPSWIGFDFFVDYLGDSVAVLAGAVLGDAVVAGAVVAGAVVAGAVVAGAAGLSDAVSLFGALTGTVALWGAFALSTGAAACG